MCNDTPSLSRPFPSQLITGVCPWVSEGIVRILLREGLCRRLSNMENAEGAEGDRGGSGGSDEWRFLPLLFSTIERTFTQSPSVGGHCAVPQMQR